MNKLYINRFSVSGPEGDEFHAYVSYEPQYENGICTSVRVTISGSLTLSGIRDENGNNVSLEWSEDWPVGSVTAIYLQNKTETLTVSGRYGGSETVTINVYQIGTSEGGSDPTPSPEPGLANPEYELYNGLIYEYDSKFPLEDIVIDGKYIAEIWYNGTMIWGYREVDQTTKPFNFTIDEIQYTATPGMTWAQWKASSYGKETEYDIYGNYVENFRGNRVYRMDPTTVWAMGTDEIIRNGEYYCNM